MVGQGVESLRTHMRWAVLVAFTVGLVVVAMSAPPRASADTMIHVTPQDGDETAVDGSCSLREAVWFTLGTIEPDCSAFPLSGTTTIVVPEGCYRISTRLELGDRTRLVGAGPGPASCTNGGTVIQQQKPDWVLHNSAPGDATVSGMTLTDGRGSKGGAIYNNATLALDNVLITGNAAADGPPAGFGGNGGGIFNDAGGSLTITNSTISGNHAGDGAPGGNSSAGFGGDGGGIENEGDLAIVRSTITGNSAGKGGDGAPGLAAGHVGGGGGLGGGIFSGGSNPTLSIEGSTISGNYAGAGGAGGEGNVGGEGGSGGAGGGIFSVGPLILSDSTVSGNAAGAGGAGGQGVGAPLPGPGGRGSLGGSGGGVSAGDVTYMTNVTVSGNSVGMGGAGGPGRPPGSVGPAGHGAALYAFGPVALTSATVAMNGTDGGADIFADSIGSVVETGSVVAAQGGQINCAGPGTFTDGGHDLVFGDKTCPGASADPKLGPLRDNGGPTPTMALLPGSGALDLVPPGMSCLPADQRGVARPQAGRCDAGAYEVAPPVIATEAAHATSATTATVAATVDPNEQDATVTVRFGTTTAYGSKTQAQDAGAGNTAIPISVPLGGLSPGTTYHAQLVATNADGSSSSSDVSFTTPVAGGGLTPPAPVLSRVRESARRWLEGTHAAVISVKRTLPIGTTFSFVLNEPATVTVAFTQTVPGRRLKARCLPSTQHMARTRRCRVTVNRGTLSLTAHAGANRMGFQGVLARGRRLKPGTYTAVLTAAAAGAPRSARSTLTFTIVARVR
jgi:hypothetical protein